MAQDGAGELREEALDQVEPGAVLGREGKVEAAWRPGGEPGSGFPRNVCGMVVEDQLDRGAGRIGGIEKLEEFDELCQRLSKNASAGRSKSTSAKLVRRPAELGALGLGVRLGSDYPRADLFAHD